MEVVVHQKQLQRRCARTGLGNSTLRKCLIDVVCLVHLRGEGDSAVPTRHSGVHSEWPPELVAVRRSETVPNTAWLKPGRAGHDVGNARRDGSCIRATSRYSGGTCAWLTACPFHLRCSAWVRNCWPENNYVSCTCKPVHIPLLCTSAMCLKQASQFQVAHSCEPECM